MKDYKFWAQWPKAYQIFYFTLLLVFLILLVNYFVTYSLGLQNILSWNTDSSLQNVKYNLRDFSVGLFNFNIPAYSYIIEELFVPADFHVNTTWAHLYIIITFFCLALFNSIITVLNRTYFLGGIAILIFAFLVMKFDLLGLFGIYESYIVAGFLIVLTAFSYYFHAFKTDLSFFKRLFCFLALYASILLITYFFSQEPLPLVSLALHAVLFTGIVSLIFIIMVAHELIYGFLFLVTYAARPDSKNTLMHFVLVSLLYFVCLLMLYLKIMGFSDFEIFGTNAFLILPFSVLIGIYGLRARENTYGGIVSFHPYGAFLYLILAATTFSTLGYFFATYNDPAIEAFQDYIIFIHIGVGLIFFIYIFANFGTLLKKSLPVYKIAYKPERLPFYFVRLGGLLIAGVLLVRTNYLSLGQSVSAYMIGMGDYAYAKANPSVAKQYYLLSKNYDNYNFRANYTLGEIFLAENKYTDAAYHFQETFFRNPTPQGYVKLADIALKNDLYFDAIYALKEGLKRIPKQGYLYNNLSLLYNRTAFVDSAYIFLNSARQFAPTVDEINSNYWGFLARNNALFLNSADSILKTERIPDTAPGITNRLAFMNAIFQKADEISLNNLYSDSTFNEETFSLLNNSVLNQIQATASSNVDSSLVKYLDSQIKKHSEASFGENLSLLKAKYLYSNKNTREAFAIVDRLAKEGVTNTGYFNLLLGLWSMENKAYRLSVDYFNSALEKGNKESFFYKAVALSEAGDLNAAIQAWDNVIQLNDPSTTDLAIGLKGVLSESNFTNFFDFGDEFRYYALRYRFNELSPEQREGLIQNFEDPQIGIAAKLLSASYAVENGDFEKTKLLIDELKNNQSLSRARKANLHDVTSKYLIATGKSVEEVVNAPGLEADKKYHLMAKSYEKQGKAGEAELNYLSALMASPFERGVIFDAIEFYNNQNKSEAAYNVALDASKLNPYSTSILKQYILQSLRVNLISYANDGMEKLEEIASEKEFRDFQLVFEAEKKKQETSDTIWQ